MTYIKPNPKFACTECSRTFKTARALRAHNKAKHKTQIKNVAQNSNSPSSREAK